MTFDKSKAFGSARKKAISQEEEARRILWQRVYEAGSKDESYQRELAENPKQAIEKIAKTLPKDKLKSLSKETIEDTALVLSRYVDLIMFRAMKSEDMKELAKHATVPVISGLDD